MVAVCRETLEEARPLRSLDLASDDQKRLRGFQFLSAKPLLLVVNVDEKQLVTNVRGAGLADAMNRAGLTTYLSRVELGVTVRLFLVMLKRSPPMRNLSLLVVGA